ncbi:unnamed protein product [Schistosoma curassoni]|uniref:Uncharacterized protein n=1 Tax=Schistosoma curassoni TaxID=6186 RepID=A0A183JSQ1_9TREM|nr:unnamed protein product [Schistosoma curassoni]
MCTFSFVVVILSFFIGRLLTVKFLRDNKYCLRFPEAHSITQPLQIEDFE